MAEKLGYDNFVQMGYERMNRTDYDSKMVANYREEIRKHVVPLASKLLKAQAKRIGVDKLMHYDISYKYPDGNPNPKGNPEWILAKAAQMYKELSPETHEFFTFMQEKELMDLVAKPGKAPGGYCTYIGGMRAPYIFSNFNGTSGDIDVLTHEAGHAFQVYQSRDFSIPEYQWPTMEACEIHSMSMEFLTWPWMKSFFEEDVDKYYEAHLSSALLFLPYGVAVDEFQHEVYEHPQWTPAQRNESWLSIQKKYLPEWDVTEDSFLSSGGFWQKQAHIFEMPFYYIDYTLAQVCALQFWKRSRENKGLAWSDYLRLCKAGGSLSFLELVDLAGLKSPFEAGTVAEVVGEAEQYLEIVSCKG
jgi:M3 family oligoendopeptidase